MPGAHAKVHLHVNDPAIYLSLEGQDEVEEVLSHAVTVQTHGAKEVANRKHGAHSPQSGFAIVKVDERKTVRILGAVHISPTGKVTQSEDVIPTKAEVMPGKHWLKLTPETTLTIGEYALVEILSPSDISQSVWDFRVDPRTGDNPGFAGADSEVEIADAPRRRRYGASRRASLMRRCSHSSLEKMRGPTSMRRGIMLKTATRLQGRPSRVRKPFSLRSLTMAE